MTLLFAIMLIAGFLVEWPPADESVFPATIDTTYAEFGTSTLEADDGDGNTDNPTVKIETPTPTPTPTLPLLRGGGGGGASANEVDDGSEAPENPVPTEPQSPIADAGGDKTSSTTSVALDGSGSHDPDGTIKSYLWELNSGETREPIGISESITHNFGGLGTYQVSLTVTDEDGLTGTDNADIKIVSSAEIPEFSTIALPVTLILGLLFFFNHRKRRKEE